MRFLFLLVLVSAAAGISGYFYFQSMESGTEEIIVQSVVPKKAQHPNYLRIALQSEIPHLDPGLAEDTNTIEVVEQLFLGLTDYDPVTFDVVPELATDWSTDQSGRTYVFNLRKDVKWTNGKPVTAHDIEWALKRNIDPETASPYAYVLYPLVNALKINQKKINDLNRLGVKALDAYTIQFKLTEPAGYFPAMAGLWTYRPLPVETVKKYGDKWTDQDNIVTNGSYLLKDRRRDDRTILVKNPSYFEAHKVKIPEVRYLIIPESSTGLAMYENDELDIIGGKFLPLPSPEIPRIKNDFLLGNQFLTSPDFCTYYFGFNTSRKPTNNRLVRKAIAASIDRQMIIDQVVKGGQEPATTFTRPPIFGSVAPSEGIGIEFDPEQARYWLAEAGYPGGKGFPQMTLMHNTSENHAQIAQAVQSSIQKHLNISVRVVNQEMRVFLRTTTKPNAPQMHRLGWCADYPDANNFLHENFHPTKSTNRLHWKNKEFARITDEAQRSTDPEKRKRLYRRAEQILTEEEAAIVPLYFYTALYLIKPWVKNFKHMPLGGGQVRYWVLD